MNVEREEVDIDRLLASGTYAEVTDGLAVLIDRLKAVQVQLCHEKDAPSREPGWRGRAVGAIRHIEGEIRLLKGRKSALSVAPGGPANMLPKPKGPAQRSKQANPKPERMVRVLHGTPDEIAEEIQAWLDDGWSAMNVVALPDGVLAVFRKDFES